MGNPQSRPQAPYRAPSYTDCVAVLTEIFQHGCRAIGRPEHDLTADQYEEVSDIVPLFFASYFHGNTSLNVCTVYTEIRLRSAGEGIDTDEHVDYYERQSYAPRTPCGRLDTLIQRIKANETSPRFVVQPVGLHFDNGSGHANMLLYDLVKRHVLVFEPHGRAKGEVVRAVREFLMKSLPPEWAILPASDEIGLCPLQERVPDEVRNGFCRLYVAMSVFAYIVCSRGGTITDPDVYELVVAAARRVWPGDAQNLPILTRNAVIAFACYVEAWALSHGFDELELRLDQIRRVADTRDRQAVMSGSAEAVRRANDVYNHIAHVEELFANGNARAALDMLQRDFEQFTRLDLNHVRFVRELRRQYLRDKQELRQRTTSEAWMRKLNRHYRYYKLLDNAVGEDDVDGYNTIYSEWLREPPFEMPRLRKRKR